MANQVWRKPTGRGSFVEVEEHANAFCVYEIVEGLSVMLFRFDDRETAIQCARDYIADRPLGIRAENIVR